jgi:antibiotic biosynthesis monooxygenase (ABM) superfamily enzyme
MIRFIHCMKARPDVSLEAFRQFWHGDEFRQQLSELAVQAGSREIRRNLTLQVETNERLQRERGAESSYDAILEIWFDHAAGLQDLLESSEFQALLQRMERLQADFVDFQASKRFFTEWTDS